MKNGKEKIDTTKLISNRIYLIDNLDKLIKESVYYRSNSAPIILDNRIYIGNISEQEIKQKIL